MRANQGKIKGFSSLKTMKLSIFVVLVSLFFCNFVPVYAGFFDFLDIFKMDDNSEVILPANSQNMALLEASFNPVAETKLKQRNGQGGGDINIVNQSALLPDSGPLGTIVEVEEQEAFSDRISLYVVREGDNLSGIAKMFNVSVNTIIWTNDIRRGDLIKPGQALTILPVTGLQYTIKKGDTIQKIASKFGGDVDEIIGYNDLSKEGSLAVGDVITIPNGVDSSRAYVSEAGKPKGLDSAYYEIKTRGTNAPLYAGYYMRPISGGVKSQGLHGYNGIDLANSCGTPIVASATGDVVISKNSGWNAGYGNYVAIAHSNGTQTLYAHMQSVIVSRGWHVVKGQTIGYLGTTGRSTGCHIHFEIRGAKNPF